MKANRRAKRRARQQRKARQRLLNPTPKQLRKERVAGARLEYKPVIKAAQDQIRISRTAQNQLNQFYGNYRGEVGRTADKADQTYQGLYDKSRSAARDLADRYDRGQEAMTAEDQKSAAIRGANPDGEAAARNQAGESQRQNLMNADSQLLAQLGSAASGYLRNVALASRQGQRLDNRRERNIRQNARNDIRDAKKERNAKTVAMRGDQRAAEREWSLSRQTLKKDYGYQNAMKYVADQGVKKAGITGAAFGGGRGGGSGGGRGGGNNKDNRRAMAYAREGIRDAGGTWGNWRELKANRVVIIDGLINRNVDPAVARRTYNALFRRWRKQRGGKPAKPGRGDYR